MSQNADVITQNIAITRTIIWETISYVVAIPFVNRLTYVAGFFTNVMVRCDPNWLVACSVNSVAPGSVD